MEFDFSCARALKLDDAQPGPQVANLDTASTRGGRDIYGRQEHVRKILEAMGVASARAQGLRSAITSLERLQSDQRIFLLAEKNVVYGILKVGRKKLFIDHNSVMTEMSPLCVLDFYVHESKQRSGFGRNLFEAMLAAEQTSAARLAYDRPSPKLLGFLRKHYALTAYTPQNNNFVVFNRYFENDRTTRPAQADSRGPHSAPRAGATGLGRALPAAGQGSMRRKSCGVVPGLVSA
jgi:alpha-tubulin N-acetyltransferase 1